MDHEAPEPSLEGAEHVATEQTIEDRVEALERLVAGLLARTDANAAYPLIAVPDYASLVNNPPDESTT